MITHSSALLMGLLAWCGVCAEPSAQQAPLPPALFQGSVLLAGEGDVPACVFDAFLRASGGSTADIVVIATDGRARTVKRWKEHGARTVNSVRKAPKSTEELVLALLQAEGVWLEDGAEALFDLPVFRPLLLDVLARGGALGGSGDGALALASADSTEGGRALGLLPNSRLQLLARKSASRKESAAFEALVTPGDATVGWQVPSGAALLLHRERSVGVLGSGSVVVLVAATPDWPERRATFDGMDVLESVDELPRDLDLLAWIRSAQERLGPAFPPAVAPTPKLGQGTLILHGGDGIPSPVWRRFLKAAGGQEALIVCLPSAGRFGPHEAVDSHSADELRNHGATNVHIVHATAAVDAEQDERALALLEEATGVWIDGGRTYRLMDAFQNTRVAQAIHDVLKRGGAVGGSSAGCQVLGDFLVRGNPRTNKTIAFDGYTRGFGCLAGVVLDAHFLQRNRHAEFVGLMERFPQLLGIGVDEKTTLIVEGSKAEVLGRNAVSFYDWTAESPEPVVLEEGATYDLAKRRAE